MSVLLLIIAPPLLIGGLLLLVMQGLWPQRIGDEPHCGKCDYVLIGLKSDRCPECGNPLNERSIVHGQRNRRVGPIIAGGVLTLLGIAGFLMVMTGVVGGIDWYSLKPTWMVIRDLQANNPRALSELSRRETNKSLSPGQISQIADVAIQQQTSPIGSSLLDFAGRHFAELSSAQQQKMLQQAFQTLPLRVRPIVIVPDQVPWLMEEHVRLPQGWWARYESTEGAIDGKKIPFAGGGGSNSGNGGGGSNGSSVPCTQPGDHQLQLVLHIEIHDGPFDNSPASKLLYREDRKLSAAFKIVGASETPAVKLLEDPSLTKQIKDSITPKDFVFGQNGYQRIIGQLYVQNVPADVAFGVFIRFDGREFSLGSIHQSKGSSTDYSIGSDKFPPGAVPNKADLILRSDVGVARNTVDQVEIWNGELIYPDVPIQQSPDLTKPGKPQ